MMVESAKKKAKIQSQNIREQLKRLLESREPTENGSCLMQKVINI